MLTYNLPTKQKEVLEYIMWHIKEKKQSPTMKEIADELEMIEQNVHSVLEALEMKGKIKRDKYKHRSITLIEGGKHG